MLKPCTMSSSNVSALLLHGDRAEHVLRVELEALHDDGARLLLDVVAEAALQLAGRAGVLERRVAILAPAHGVRGARPFLVLDEAIPLVLVGPVSDERRLLYRLREDVVLARDGQPLVVAVQRARQDEALVLLDRELDLVVRVELVLRPELQRRALLVPLRRRLD